MGAPIKKKLTTFHSVEFLRPRRRVPERGDFRLDIDVEIETVDRKDLVEAFDYRRPDDEPVTLYGYKGGLWKPALISKDSFDVLTEKNSDQILIDRDVYQPLGLPMDAKKEFTRPHLIEPYAAVPNTRILTDDREKKVAIAHQAIERVISVNGKIWVRANDPVWAVRLNEHYDDINLLHSRESFNPKNIGSHTMRFRVDRLPEALAWHQLLNGKKSPKLLDPDRAAGKLAEMHVRLLNPDFLSRDDVVEFAGHHLADVVRACAAVLASMPPDLRHKWETLRQAIDNLMGTTPRVAAEMGLRLVPETLASLETVRDIPDNVRIPLMRTITKLRSAQRRTAMIEGILPDDAIAEANKDELALEEFAP